MSAGPGPEAVLRRRREVAWRVFEGEAILVVTVSDEICHLNPVASFIWEELDGERDLRSLAAAVSAEFDVGGEEALRDALEFAAALLKKGMVELA